MRSVFQGHPSSGSRRESVSLEDKEDTRFARTTEIGKEFVVVEFRDSKDVLLVSNVHVFGTKTEMPQVESVHGK